MSTAADGLPSRKQTALLWIAHRQLWFTGLMVAVMIATIVNGDYLPLFLTNIAIFAWIIGGSVVMIHQEGPYGNNCIECMYRRPDDGGQQAEKRLHFLWFSHKTFLKFIATMGTLALFVALSRWSFTLSIALYAVSFSLIDYIDHVHHKLRPWCPWCKHRGHGDTHVCTPAPDPSMTKVN